MRDIAQGWTLYQGGLGSGKTWAAARKLLWLHAVNNCPSLAVAPTYGDLWRFVAPGLVSVCEEWQWPYELIRNIVPQIVIQDNPIYLISAEHPERFAGFEVGALWVDEGARIQSDRDNPLRDAPTQIRTRLRHPRARYLHGMVSTTPEGSDTWVQRDWFDRPLPQHRAYIGKTRDNAALRPEYLAAQMASLPAELVEQYLDGKAVSYVANRAHPTFAPATHVREIPWNSALPLHLGADYNVSPMCWVAVQIDKEEVRVLDEVVLPDFGQVDGAMQAAHDQGWGKYFVRLHPDKSAKARSTVGDPEFTTMRNAATRLGWRFTGDANGANPPVDARINLLSRTLLDATGKRRLVVHPRCVRVIEDLQRTARATNGYDPGAEGKRGHILDALGYVVWDECRPGNAITARNI